MRKLFFILPAALLLGVAACTGKGASDAGADGEEPDPALLDSTLYGTLCEDEMGMSTFAIRLREDSTLLALDRDGEDGPAQIYGDIADGDEWAITVRNGGTERQSLSTAINLTQVRRFVKAFHISNGRLVLNDSDFVDIVSIDSDSLVYRDASGAVDRFYKYLDY